MEMQFYDAAVKGNKKSLHSLLHEDQQKMEMRLYDAAVQGNKISLLNLLREDALLLDRFITGRFRETPLHVAAMLGHYEFVDEVMTRKPELAQELNSRKSSPLHLATAKGYLDIVKRLLQVNPDMCHAFDIDGRNPLHIAAMKGHLDVLRELVHAEPWAARSLMEDGVTILHACVREKQLETLKFLVETVLSDYDLVNFQNRDGNTILHLAIIDKQKEAISFLRSIRTVDLKCKNKEGFASQDLLDERKMLFNWLQGKRNTAGVEKLYESLMIVATLLAAMAFQAAVNPPSGVWQEDKDGPDGHKAGLSILAKNGKGRYIRFLDSNTTGFLASIITILMLVSGLPLKNNFFMCILVCTIWVGVIAMGYAYTQSLKALTPDDNGSLSRIDRTVEITTLVLCFLLFILSYGHWKRMHDKLKTKWENVFSTKPKEVKSVRETLGSDPV